MPRQQLEYIPLPKEKVKEAKRIKKLHDEKTTKSFREFKQQFSLLKLCLEGADKFDIKQEVKMKGSDPDCQPKYKGKFAGVHECARRGDIENVRALVDCGGNIDIRNKYGRTALMYAVTERPVEEVAEILKIGASIEAEDEMGWRALHFAAIRGDAAIIDLLIANGANCMARHKAGNRALELMAHTFADYARMLPYQSLFRAVVNYQTTFVANIFSKIISGSGIGHGEDVQFVQDCFSDKFVSIGRSTDAGKEPRPDATIKNMKIYWDSWERYLSGTKGELSLSFRWSKKTMPDEVRGRFEIKGVLKGNKKTKFKDSGMIEIILVDDKISSEKLQYDVQQK